MLPEEIANIWIPRGYSLLHFANFNLFLPNLQHQATGKDGHDSESFATLLFYTIWAVVHICYKKSLNSFLRRMRLPFVQRNRIIDGLWVCGFSACSMVFLTYFVPENIDRSCPWRKTNNFQLDILIHKTFYLHQATTELFVNHFWLKGWAIGLFASGISTAVQQKSAAINILLFYQASDGLLLNSSRILLTLSRQTFVKRVAKFIFLLHLINWIYIHILLVPGSLILLYLDRSRNWKIQASLWLWLICEIYNSVRYKEFGGIYSMQCWEKSLFRPASEEAVEFVNILKKHRNSVTNNKVANGTSANRQKTELWQTLFCAMTIKKKLKKRNRAKRVAEEERGDFN